MAADPLGLSENTVAAVSHGPDGKMKYAKLLVYANATDQKKKAGPAGGHGKAPKPADPLLKATVHILINGGTVLLQAELTAAAGPIVGSLVGGPLASALSDGLNEAAQELLDGTPLDKLDGNKILRSTLIGGATGMISGAGGGLANVMTSPVQQFIANVSTNAVAGWSDSAISSGKYGQMGPDDYINVGANIGGGFLKF
jgi:hypothetical protein